MINFQNIIKYISPIQIIGTVDRYVNKITLDSRSIVQNDVFIAIKGFQVDGHQFINRAIQNGSKIIVCTELPLNIDNEITFILVQNSRHALGILSKNLYDSQNLFYAIGFLLMIFLVWFKKDF